MAVDIDGDAAESLSRFTPTVSLEFRKSAEKKHEILMSLQLDTMRPVSSYAKDLYLIGTSLRGCSSRSIRRMHGRGVMGLRC